MPKRTTTNRLPSRRKHKPSGQAMVTLGGQDHYLGTHDTEACRAAPAVGDGWTFAVPVPRATLRPVCYERAAGLLERWAATGADVATAGAGYPVSCH